MSKLCNFFLVLMCAIYFSANLGAGVVDDQLRGLDQALQEDEVHYGMAWFKEWHFGVTVEGFREKYSRLIRTATTLEEDMGLVPRVERNVLSDEQYHQLLIQLAAERRDGHFNTLRSYSNDSWTVGIYAVAVDGVLRVQGFKDFFPKGNSVLEPKLWDEIVEVNGEPVAKIAERLELGVSLATYESRMGLAYKLILNPAHRWVPAVKPRDEVRIKFRRPNPKYSKDKADQPEFLEFEGLYHWVSNSDYNRARSWFPYDDPTVPDDAFIYGYRGIRTYFSEGLNALGDDVSVIPYDSLFNAEIERAKAATKKSETGSSETTNAKRPELFPSTVDETAELADLKVVTSLPVYIVRYQGKNIGVVRIPDFGFFVDEVRWLGEIIPRLNKLTDVLVIDQLGNGGGYVWSGAQLARLFAHGKEFASMSMNFRLSRTLLKTLEEWVAEDERDHGIPFDPNNEIRPGAKPKNPNEDLLPPPNFMRLYLERARIDEWKARFERGERYSGFVPYFGVQDGYRQNGHGRIVGREGKVYEKPVLILNDQFSASCGDFFPSIMQVNGRALIRGMTSAGLGAPVYRGTQLSYSELSHRCPFGDCLKPDNLPIENVGALPDFPRWISAADGLESFKGWTRESLDIAVKMGNGVKHEELKAEYRRDFDNGGSNNEVFKSAKKIFQDLAQILSSASSVDDIIKAYDQFFESLGSVKTEKISQSDWDYLNLSLPQSLLAKDVILMSLRRPVEILDRLNQMKRLSRFRDSKDDARLIDYLAANIMRVSKARRFTCYDLMKALPEYKQPV